MFLTKFFEKSPGKPGMFPVGDVVPLLPDAYLSVDITDINAPNLSRVLTEYSPVIHSVVEYDHRIDGKRRCQATSQMTLPGQLSASPGDRNLMAGLRVASMCRYEGGPITVRLALVGVPTASYLPDVFSLISVAASTAGGALADAAVRAAEALLANTGKNRFEIGLQDEILQHAGTWIVAPQRSAERFKDAKLTAKGQLEQDVAAEDAYIVLRVSQSTTLASWSHLQDLREIYGRLQSAVVARADERMELLEVFRNTCLAHPDLTLQDRRRFVRYVTEELEPLIKRRLGGAASTSLASFDEFARVVISK
jgi:hypothetical protein